MMQMQKYRSNRCSTTYCIYYQQQIYYLLLDFSHYKLLLLASCGCVDDKEESEQVKVVLKLESQYLCISIHSQQLHSISNEEDSKIRSGQTNRNGGGGVGLAAAVGVTFPLTLTTKLDREIELYIQAMINRGRTVGKRRLMQ